MRSQKYRYSLSKWMKMKKWNASKYYRKGHRYYPLLPSLYYENQTWGALHKAWIAYVIAIKKYEFEKEIYYAHVIQKLQKELNLKVSDFECLEGLDEEY